MAEGSAYNRELADLAVSFIGCLKHTKGEWYGQNFELIDWQEQIIRDLFGIVKPNGYRQFNTAYIEIAKKQGKSELAAAVALLLTCGDMEYGGESMAAPPTGSRLPSYSTWPVAWWSNARLSNPASSRCCRRTR